MNMGSGDSLSSLSSRDEGPRPLIPDYEVLRKIGGGSYGEVWLARDMMGQHRAVKVIHRGHFREDRPYQREFEGIRRFQLVSQHPSQVTIFHVGRNDERGYFYYVMELADDRREGEGFAPDLYEPRTLRSELKERGGLPVADCLEIGLSLATALAHLHKAGLVHRDIKPSNVIFVHGLPKLADIGLVTSADEECSFVGTEGYVGPEGPGKAQADIYALGMVLYEMITGVSAKDYPRLPEEWENSSERRKLIELNQVVMKACEHDPKQRYQSAEAMWAELELVLHNESLVGIRRLKRLSRMLLAGLVIAGAGLGWVLFGLSGLKTERASLGAKLAEKMRLLDEREGKTVAKAVAARVLGRPFGWSSAAWDSLKEDTKATQGRWTPRDPTAFLSDLDATSSNIFRRTSGSSAAIAPDGRVVVSGAGANCAHLIDVDGKSHPLPVFGEGPVYWPPDGAPRQFAVLSNSLALRNATNGQVLLWFQVTNTAAVPPDAALAITPDGRRVAAAFVQRLFAWTVDDRALLGETTAQVTALALSPDGALLAAGNEQGEVRVYSVDGLTELALLRPPQRGTSILCLAFGRDANVSDGPINPFGGWLLATGDEGAEIVIWDLARRLPRSYCRGSPWRVTAVAFHPNGMILASAGRNEPRLWDVASGEPLLRLGHQSGGDSRALAIDATGRRLVVGGEADKPQDATIVLWDLEMQRGIHTLYGLGQSSARKVWFSPNSARVAALSDARQLCVWDVAKDCLLYRFDGPAGSLADQTGGCFDTTGGRFAVASIEEARLFDMNNSGNSRGWKLERRGWANQVQYDADGRWLLLRMELAESGGTERGGQRYVWRIYQLTDAKAPILIDEQADTDWSAHDLAFAPGGKVFLVWHEVLREGTTNVVIRGYQVQGRKCLQVWEHTTKATDVDLRVAFDPLGEYVGYTEYKGREPSRANTLRLMQLSDFREIGYKPENGEVAFEAVSPSATSFASSGRIFSDLTGATNAIGFGSDRLPLSWIETFSPHGRFLAQGTEHGVVLVVDIPEVRKRLDRLGK